MIATADQPAPAPLPRDHARVGRPTGDAYVDLQRAEHLSWHACRLAYVELAALSLLDYHGRENGRRRVDRARDHWWRDVLALDAAKAGA